MKLSAKVLSILLVVLVVAGGVWLVVDRNTGDPDVAPVAATPAAGAPSSVQSGDAPSWLFTMRAGAGTLEARDDGTYALDLTGVDRRVTAFTDRPDRDAAVIPLRLLLEVWPRMFADSPPNAVLAADNPDGTSMSLVVTLSDPVREGTTVSFTAEIVETNRRARTLTGLADIDTAAPPTSFGAVDLFIDDVTPSFLCEIGAGNDTVVYGTLPMDSPPSEIESFVQWCDTIPAFVKPDPYAP